MWKSGLEFKFLEGNLDELKDFKGLFRQPPFMPPPG